MEMGVGGTGGGPLGHAAVVALRVPVRTIRSQGDNLPKHSDQPLDCAPSGRLKISVARKWHSICIYIVRPRPKEPTCHLHRAFTD